MGLFFLLPLRNPMSVKSLALSSGFKMPIIGLGTFLSKPGEVENAVSIALKNGYRAIDCAHVYQNETEVGKAIANSGLERDDLFVTSKLWNTCHRPERVLPALKKPLKIFNYLILIFILFIGQLLLLLMVMNYFQLMKMVTVFLTMMLIMLQHGKQWNNVLQKVL